MISIIVVTHNRKVLLNQCLKSLINQDFIEPYEIIVVDNNSCDDTAEFLENYCPNNKNIVYSRHSTTRSLAQCKRVAIQKSHGELIAFIDDDCVASKDWLKRINNGSESSDIVAGAVLAANDIQWPPWWTNSLNWLIGVNPTPYEGFLPLGSNIAFKRHILKHIDENTLPPCSSIVNNLPYAEDNYRLTKALGFGFNMHIDEHAIVYHHIPRERLAIRYLIKRSYYEGVCQVLFNRSFKKFWISLIALMLNPLRFLLSWDYNRLFRMIVNLSYVYNYVKCLVVSR